MTTVFSHDDINQAMTNWQAEVDSHTTRQSRIQTEFKNLSHDEKYVMTQWLLAAMAHGMEVGYIKGSCQCGQS